MMKKLLAAAIIAVACILAGTAPEAMLRGIPAAGVPGNQQSISASSITLSNQTFTSTGSIVNVGSVSVTPSPSLPAFNGTLLLGGTDAAKFQLTSATLPSTLQAKAATGNGSYSVSITATQAGLSGSPATQNFTITGSTASLLVSRSATNFDSVTANANNFYSIYQGFAQGAVPSGNHVELRLSDGVTAIATQQCSNRVAWGDGSLKGCNLIWKHPNSLVASASDTVKLYNVGGGFNDTCPGGISTATITARDFRTEMVVSAVTYTFDVNAEIAGGTHVRQIRAGPAACAWEVWGPLRNGTTLGSTDQGSLWAKEFIYVYADSTIRRFSQIFSSRIQNSSAITVDSYACKDYNLGSPTTFSWGSSFTMPYGTVVGCLDTTGLEYYSGSQPATVDKVVWRLPILTFGDPTTTGFYDAKMTPFWLHSTPTERSSIGPGTNFPYFPLNPNYPSDNGTNPIGWDKPGGSDFIGHLARNDARMWLVGDWQTMVNDRLNIGLTGWINSYWFYDLTTGLPPPLNNGPAAGGNYSGLAAATPTVGWGRGASLTLGGGIQTGSGTNPSHAPGFGYWMYLQTGYEWWLEIAQGIYNGSVGADSPGSRDQIGGGIGGYWGTNFGTDAARGAGWRERNLFNAEWVTPDAHPMKPYLADMEAVYVSGLDAFSNRQGDPPLWADIDFGENTGFRLWDPWMHDHLLVETAIQIWRGKEPLAANFVTRHLTLAVLGRGVNGCMYNAPSYNWGLGTNSDGTGPFATAWSQVWIVSAGIHVTDSCIGSGFNPFTAASGYDNEYARLFHISGVAGEIVGMTGGSTIRIYAQAAEGPFNGQSTLEASWATEPEKRIRLPQ